MLGDQSLAVNNLIQINYLETYDDFNVCLIEGVRVSTHNTNDRWLLDTGAGMSVMSVGTFDFYKTCALVVFVVKSGE
jgi:hypothetical protein